jgi:hypothetical protein
MRCYKCGRKLERQWHTFYSGTFTFGERLRIRQFNLPVITNYRTDTFGRPKKNFYWHVNTRVKTTHKPLYHCNRISCGGSMYRDPTAWYLKTIYDRTKHQHGEMRHDYRRRFERKG